MAEFRWILLGLGILLIAGIWWWGVRRSRQLPGNAQLRESAPLPAHSAMAAPGPAAPAGQSTPQEPVLPENAGHASRDWGVPPFEPLSIRTADFDHLQVMDLPMTATADPLDVTLNMSYAEHEIAATPPAAAAISTEFDHVPPGLAAAPELYPNADHAPRLELAEPYSEPGLGRSFDRELERDTEPELGRSFDRELERYSEPEHGRHYSEPELGRYSDPELGPSSDPEVGRSSESGSAAVSSPRGTIPARLRVEPSVAEPATAPPQAPDVSETQRIVTIRVCASGESPWAGADLMASLQSHGLGYGRYKVFHRKHSDGRTLFCAASLVEPGTFELARMPQEEFRGLTLFAVLPGPADGLQTIDTLIATAAELAHDLRGTVQDSRGAPLSAQRADALREDVARFQASLHTT